MARPEAVMALALPLEAVDREQHNQVGGKASGLAWLLELRLPVPAGFCLSTQAYRAALDFNGLLQSERSGLLDPAAAERLHRTLRTAALPPEVEAALEKAQAALRPAEDGQLAGAFAVRSSATVEDGGADSFAGQFQTVLDVRGLEGIVDAVRACWSSLWSPHAVAYRRDRVSSAGQRWEMAVIVQRLVAADFAGVAFTVHPLSGDTDRIVINAGYGLAAGIVSGSNPADLYTLQKSSGALVESHIARKEERLICSAARGVCKVPVPEVEAVRPALDRDRLAALTEVAVQVEDAAGKPMDIEWAFAGTSLQLVQARPVTGLGPRSPGRKRAGSSGGTVWNHAGELFPGPVAWWDVFLFEDFLAVYNDCRAEWGDGAADLRCRVVDGYLYMADVPRTCPPPSGNGAESRRRLVKEIPHAWRTRVRPAIRRDCGAWLGRDLDAAGDDELLDFLREILTRRRLHERWGLYAGMVPEFSIDRLNECLGDDLTAGGTLTAQLTQGLPSLAEELEQDLGTLIEQVRRPGALREAVLSGSPVEAVAVLRESAAVWRPIGNFLAVWGFHGIDAITSPTWSEDPASLVALLRKRAEGAEESPTKRLGRLVRRREAAVAGVLARLPHDRQRVFEARLADAHTCVPLNQDRYITVVEMSYAAVRRVLLALGRRLEASGSLSQAEDVFLVSLGALSSAVKRVTPLDRARVDAARQAWLRAGRSAPTEAVDETGAPVRTSTESASAIDGVLAGSPASPGRACGRAAVVRNLAEAETLQRGDVLVTKMTTPAWTPYFSLLAAIVTETGSLLSHPAVLAREYGIPAVVSAAGATRLLVDGQPIEVDGDRGEVRPRSRNNPGDRESPSRG